MRLDKMPGLGGLWQWMRARVVEPTTWAGMAMIAIVLGSDPMQAHGVAEAVSLIVGGGLVARTRAGTAAGENGDDGVAGESDAGGEGN